MATNLAKLNTVYSGVESDPTKITASLKLATGVAVHGDDLYFCTVAPNSVFKYVKAEDGTYSWVEQGELAANVTASVTPTLTVGGISANKNYTFNTFKQFLDAFLVKYVDASGQNVTSTVGGGVYEHGATANVSAINFSVKRGSTNVTNFGANDGEKDYEIAAPANTAVGQTVTGTLSFDKPIAVTADRGGFNWTIKYLAEDGKTIKELTGTTAGFNFKDKIYAGSMTKADFLATDANKSELVMDNSDLKNSNQLADSVAVLGKIASYTVPAGKSFFVACPTDFKAPLFMDGANNTSVFSTNAADTIEFDFTNASGYTSKYKIYFNGTTGGTLDNNSIVASK